ncbi:putative secreted protein (Por secretion system target) [Neolewinella xylanilytica]|uniref:Putative secreted protein (Por secretion system target) n=1 Tax=Neolewinella xylanilytica TaxID=1514080 RepID=A0A2S6I9E3_9BACT|nr:C25 family cysteine peptidase [Neolewinella xylanilytica]PPK88120.1 putative secreted protein (Por secretion system target) [Neolewinella xylanilytica]
MSRTFTIFLFTLACPLAIVAQMATESGVRYGNEWYGAGSSHLRLDVAQDGFYRVTAELIAGSGLIESTADLERLQLYHRGEPVPIDVIDGEVLFYGERARSEMDKYLFEFGEDMLLNTEYGMYTDTSAYYLGLAASPDEVLRYRPATDPTGGPTNSTIYRTTEKVYGKSQSKFFRRTAGLSVYFSHYEWNEGYGSLRSNDLLSSNGSTVTGEKLALPEAVSGQAALSLRFGLAFGDAHSQLITVNNQALATINAGDEWSLHDTTLSFALTTNQASFSIAGQAGPQDKANLAFVSVTYPARAVGTANFLSFTLPAGPSQTLEFTSGVNAGSRLYDPASATVYPILGGQFQLSAAVAERRFVLLNEAWSPAASQLVTLTDLLPPPQTDYLIITSRRLAGPELDAMADYRESSVGGNYTVHTVYVEDLYDAFGYGLRRHPQAIRNYLYAAQQVAPQLNYLFLVGKGREYTALRDRADLEAAWSTFFVPGFGFPASDNLMSADLGNPLPKLATGRLAAINREEIGIYVRKLQEVERQIYEVDQTIDDAAWMKQALFLGGGTTAGEQSAIRYNLATMENIFENSFLGGSVTSVFKTNSEPIEEARQDIIFNRINQGVSLLTFYGHSSSQGFDFNIDNPENYNNQNKYPFMLSLGCYSGDAFTEARSISERFIFLPEGGAITYAASKGLGYISALGTYGRSIFTNLSGPYYGDGVGDVLRATIDEFAGTSNFTLGILMEQFTLSGDPAFRLHPRPGPDLVIDPATVKFVPEVIPAQDSTFTVNLKVINLGTHAEGLPDSVLINVRQELPTGEIRDLARLPVPVPFYEEFVALEVPNLGIEAVGNNRLLLTIDAAGAIAELPTGSAESNNDVVIGGRPGVPFTIIANTAKVAFPPPFAVVGPGVQLVAGTSDPLAPERKYAVQVSLEADFSIPLVNEEITAAGGIIRYAPSLSFQDSTTYYWRISPDSSLTVGQGYLWSESSFTYLAARVSDDIGYALQHPGQLSQGEAQNIQVFEKNPVWAFKQNVNYIEISNGIYKSGSMPEFRKNDNRFVSPFPWKIRAGIQIIVVDSTNNRKWFSSPGDGSYNSARGVADPWSFDTRTAAGRSGMMQFLEEYVQDGQYVFVYSAQRGEDIEYHTSDWLADSTAFGRTIYGVLEAEGAEQIRLLETLGSVPYTFMFQKGIGALGEAVGDSQDAETHVRVAIRENWDNGTYTTPEVGPALSWKEMRLQFRPDNIQQQDSCHLKLFGQLATGEWDLLQDQPLSIRDQLEFTLSLSDYDATTYQHLKAELSFFDEVLRTSATLDELYIDYQRPGDVAISPAVAYSVPDTLAQGEVAKMEIGYENLSPIPMDSLLIELSVLDETNRVTRIFRRRPPLAGNGRDTVQFSLPTTSINSGLRVQLLLNPSADQPEEILFNNFLTTDLGISTDLVDPDLKVYFDGRRINNGELVSSKPEILIQLRDENTFRRLDDSSAYEIELVYPGQGNSGERIRMSDERVEYVPAPGTGDNMAEIYFRPELPVDGTYRIKVQAKDRSNNKSGLFDYEQEFEVLNEQLITNVLTYPNPFTTQTRFVYTLTGSEAPEVFRIQIMTVSGRVVRDIDLLAHETIKIGTHQTAYSWDGTDEYGDQLANGVYLYRVITADETGSPLQSHQDSGNQEFRATHAVTDQYFKNGLGKVVILR